MEDDNRISHPISSAPAADTLDPLLVVLSAQIAYDLGILTQQGPRPATLYRDSTGRPDAIGVSLRPDFALYYNELPVPGLPLNPPLSIEHATQLSRLQIASDAWARDPSNPIRERDFRTTLATLKQELLCPPPA